MGCYVKSQGCGNETYDVLTQKEINKNQTTCKCSYCLSMKSNFYTGSTRLKIVFFFSDKKLTLTKTMKMTKCLSAPDANHYKHANPKMQNLLKQSEISQKSFSFISFLVV